MKMPTSLTQADIDSDTRLCLDEAARRPGLTPRRFPLLAMCG